METATAAVTPAVRIVQGERTANRERYARVNNAWPNPTPPMTFDEGRLAAKKLWRIGTGTEWPKTFKGREVFTIKPTSGVRWTQFDGTTLYINPAKGWDDLVHTISHATWRRIKPANQEQHGTGHASHEYMLIQEVIRRGWLDGKLKRPEKLKVEKDIKALRHQTALAKLKAWQTRAKRAATAIKKLKLTINYYEKEALKPKAQVDPQKREEASKATINAKVVKLINDELNNRADDTDDGVAIGRDKAKQWLIDDLEDEPGQFGIEFQDALKSHNISRAHALSVLKSME